MKSYFRKVRKKWQLIIYISLIFGAMAFFISTLIPPKYRSDITLLVVQRNTDTLSASRSVEYLDEVFSQVLYTESFLNDVLASPLGIDKKFSSDLKTKKQQWKKEVSINKIDNAGILQISVFDSSRLQAEKIAGGIGWNYANNGNKYHGGAGNVEVKIIDGPITSSKPVYPNVFVSAIFGFLAGLLGSLVLIYLFDGFDIKVFDSRAAAPSIVEREIQRQLKKRSQQTDLKYGSDGQEIYRIKESAKTADRQKQARRTKPTEFKEEKKEKPNFLTKLYQKSLFPDKQLLKSKDAASDKEKELFRQKDHAQDEVIEHVKKLNHVKEDSGQIRLTSEEKTAPAPENLPIFLQEENELLAKEKKEGMKEAAAPTEDKAEDQQEPTDDEVKDRLNKLLKGEL